MVWQLVVQNMATWLICMLPRAVAYRLARVVGMIASRFPSRRRAALTANIAAAHGLPETHWLVRRDVRRAFQHAMLNYVDLFGVERTDAPEFIESIHVDDWQPYLDAEAQDRGVIIVSAHLGNFDTVVQKLAMRGAHVLIPVEPISPPALLTEISRRRARMGTNITPVGPDTFKELVAHVRSRGVAVIVCDRDIQGTGYATTMFGRPVTLPQAAILLGIRTGAPVIAAFGHRHADNRISAHLTGEIILRGQHGDAAASAHGRTLKATLESGMSQLVAHLEYVIGQDPGQWVVQQPVFLPAEAAPSPAGRRRDLAVSLALAAVALSVARLVGGRR